MEEAGTSVPLLLCTSVCVWECWRVLEGGGVGTSVSLPLCASVLEGVGGCWRVEEWDERVAVVVVGNTSVPCRVPMFFGN